MKYDLLQRGGVMDKEATIQARIDVEEKALPFKMNLSLSESKRTLGIADEQYVIPDDIDGSNAEIAEIFGVK